MESVIDVKDIKEYMRCNECCHKDVCMLINSNKTIGVDIPESLKTNADIVISVKCKHFQKIMPAFRDIVKQYPGTGIEYLDNQPSCTNIMEKLFEEDRNG